MISLHTFFSIIFGFILDFIIGEPQNPVHPVRLMGKVIGFFVNIYKEKKIESNIISFIFGTILAIFIIISSYFISYFLVKIFYGINFIFGFIIESIFCYLLIACRGLKDETMKVYDALNKDNIALGRKNLSYIVGRDTENLTKKSIIMAAVETVAENFSDGVIAPLFYMFIGGVPLGVVYKAVNTLDSMVGYRNKTYEYFGKFSARLDDLFNLIPSRLSAIFMIISSKILGLDVKNAVKIFLRDRYKHKSPNSAQTESVCAGALNIALGGDNYYGGVLVHKPFIGDNKSEVNIEHIKIANKLMYTSAIAFLIIFSAVYLIGAIFHV